MSHPHPTFTHGDPEHESGAAPASAPAPVTSRRRERARVMVPRWTAITTGVAGLAVGATLLGGVAFAQTPTVEEATPDTGTTQSGGWGATPAQPDFRGGRPHAFGFARHLLSLDTVAETLGMTPEELNSELESGTALTDIITAQGSSVAAVVDALVAEAQEQFDLAVSEGRITQEEADERLAELPDELTARIENGTFMARGGAGHFGGGGFDCEPAEGAGAGGTDGTDGTMPATPAMPDAAPDATEDATPTTS